MRAYFVGCVLVAVGCCSQFAHATPGGVDANGCHQSKTAGKHCHPERARHVATLPGGESVAQRDKRLKRECRGRANAGACLGYGG